MKILFISAEVAPFAKVGGLADVAGSLPKFIKNLGADIRVIMPLYGSIDKEKYGLKPVEGGRKVMKLGAKGVFVSLLEGKLPNSDVTVYFIENEEYFGSHKEVYPSEQDYWFEQERFIVFSMGALELMKQIEFQPDVVHCNDWHTGSVPAYIKTYYNNFNFYKKTKCVYSIHNLAYQGLCSEYILDFANLDLRLFNADYLEFYGGVNWMKSGIVFSEQVNTVSEKYAQEIQTSEFGERLEGLLQIYSGKLSGILNGLDYDVWNPSTDKIIAKNYTQTALSGKKACKAALQKEFALEQDPSKPLIGLISRLAMQKGLDLVERIIPKLKELDLQFIVLGTGEHNYEKLFKRQNTGSHNIRSHIGFNADLATRIYAGCDMFLMPSRFEPCGLGQLIALKYGTLPIVRETGGLADTIDDEINGFVFKEYDHYRLLDAIDRALKSYADEKRWKKLVKTAMKNDFSWNASAQKYMELYKKACG